jgi:hypothetical protein
MGFTSGKIFQGAIWKQLYNIRIFGEKMGTQMFLYRVEALATMR